MKIFVPVHCRSYLQKYSDGVHLVVSEKINFGDFGYSLNPVEGNAWDDPKIVKAVKSEYTKDGWTEREIADLSGFEGESVHKEYRRKVNDEFDGFLVGFTRIVVTGQIGTDMTMYPYNMNGDLKEVYHLTKNTETEKVGVVYFKNNSKRYVPVYDIDEKIRMNKAKEGV